LLHQHYIKALLFIHSFMHVKRSPTTFSDLNTGKTNATALQAGIISASLQSREQPGPSSLFEPLSPLPRPC
jgi:hypothetical protein